MSNEYDDLIAGAPEANEYDALLKDQASANRSNLLTAGRAAETINPDQRAQELRQAQALNLPPDVVARNPDRTAELQALNDYDALLRSSPKLAAWVAESTDNAALSKDDHGPLAALERGMSAIANDSFMTPVIDVQRAAYGEVIRLPGTILSGAGALIDAGARTIDRSVRGAFGDEIADMFWFEGPAAANPATLLDMVGEPLKAAGESVGTPEERQTLLTDVSGAVGQLSAQLVQAVFAPQTLLASLAAQGADIQQDRVEAAGAAGTAESDAAVVLGAGVTAVTEKFGIDRLLNRLPPNIKNAAMRRIADLAIAGGTEAVQELTENIAQDVITRTLVDPEHEVGQGVLREMFAAGSAATIMRAFIMSMTGARRRGQANDDKDALDAIVDASNQSKLRERDPARFAALVQQLQREGSDSVYIPVETFRELFQDPMAAARDVLGDPQEFVEATITGGDVRVPVGAYLSKIAPEHHSKLSGKVRLRADGLSADEAAEDDGRDTSRAVRDFLRSVREEPADQRVLDDVTGQLLQSGMDQATAERNAKVVDAMFRTMGQRLGVPAWELYSEYGLRVRRELPAALRQAGGVDVALDSLLDRLATGDVPTEADAFGPSLAEFLAERGGIRDDVLTGELAALAEDDKLRRKPGQRRLVNQAEGLELDRAREAAIDAGYLREDADIQDLLDALSSEVRGERATRADANRNDQVAQVREALLALREEVDRLGFDPVNDREGIRQALRGAAEGVGLEQAIDQTETPEFKVWSEGAEVFWPDELWSSYEGGPAVFRLFHGTTGDFVSFDRSKLNPESDLGAGFYFSNTPEDIAANYAGLGPDLTNKVELEAERIEQELDDDPDFEGDAAAEARRIAREQFMANEGLTMPVFVRVRNPAIIGGQHETELTFDEMFDEETEEYGEPDGTLIDFVNALRDVASNEDFFDADVEQAIEELYEAAQENQGIALSRVYEILKGAESFAYAADENGKIVRDEIIRQALESIGFDGIVDYTVDEKFGSQIRRGKPMVGMSDETVHVVAFEPEQIKSSIGNSGAFSRSNPSILYQSPTDQTQTTEFKRWFGDSKVVDDEGRPLVVYHGTRTGGFDTFSPNTRKGEQLGFGIHFSKDETIARRYAEDDDVARKGKSPQVYPVFLSIKNPLRADAIAYEGSAEFDLAYKLAGKSFYYPKDENGRRGVYLQNAIDAAPAQRAQKEIEASGYDGVIYKAKIGRRVPGGAVYSSTGESYLVFRPEQIKSATGNRGTFDPNDPSILNQSARGNIVLGRNADGSKQFTVTLFEGADLSTFLHEAGHFFLEVMADAAQRPDAPQQVRDDFAALLQWFGVESRDQIQTEQHEQFARGFEAYLFEGKAPSVELRGPFARFRAWLVSLYRNLRALNVNLTDEVRGVMDRMLATDDEISALRNEAETQPAFTDEAASGMTAEQWAAYQRLVGEATEEAERETTARVMQDIAREHKAWWKAEREKVEADVTAEVDARPVYQVSALLSRGKSPDGSDLPDGVRAVKLDKAWLLDRYGQEFLNNNLLRRRMYAVEGGVNPDALASDFGYGSGDAMVQDIINAQTRADIIKAETDQRMRETFGDMLTDGTIAEEALAAMHGNRRMRLLEAESAALARLAGRPVVRWRDIARIAAERIAAKRARDVQPGQYLRAERKAAREAVTIAKEPSRANRARLHELKVQQWLNAALYAEARRVRDEVESGRDYLSRFLKTPLRAKMGKAGATYLDQIDALLERVDFKRISARDAARRQSLAAFIAQQEADGLQVDVSPELQNEAFRKNYRDMTVEELRGLVDSVKNIEHLAKLKNRLLSAREKQAFDDAVDEFVSGVESNHDVPDEPIDFAPSLAKRFGDWMRNADAWLTKPEFLFKWLDGEKDQGPVWRLLFRPFVDAERAEQERHAVASEAMRKAFEDIDRGKLASEKLFLPEINASLTRANIMSLALNWGNEGNREAVRRGYGWTDQQIESVIARLSDAEWNAVESVWEHIDSYWADVSALQKEMTGLSPEKVEAVPFTINGRQLRGGYYPLKYDSKRSWLAFKREEGQAVQELFGGNWTRAATRKGHTIARVGSAGQQVKLDLSVATEHIGNVIHDLTHRKAVIDVQRILDDARVRATIERVAGRHAYRLLRPWVQGIAAPNPQVMNPIDAIARRMRVGGSIVNMGWKITTAIVQPLGYTQTIDAIGAKWSALGLAEFVRHPAERTKFALDRSVMLRNRMQTFDRDVRDTLARLIDGSRMDDVRRSFFILTGLMDMSVSVPTWLSAYRKAMDGAVENVPVANEQAAIDYADSMVRMTQSSGSAKDLAQIQAGGETQRLFTMFYSYFNVLYNIGRQRQRGVRGAADMPKLVASMMWLWFIPAVLSEIVAGRGPEEDEEWGSWWQRNAFMFATYPVQTVPVLRDVVNGMGRFGYSPSPAFDGLEATAKVLNVPFKLAAGEDLSRADAKAAVLAAGYWGQLPARQAWISGEYLFDVAEGNEDPDDPAEFLGGLMFARPAPQR